jgi:coenzyme F420-reducing hydrogenase delta subunit
MVWRPSSQPISPVAVTAASTAGNSRMGGQGLAELVDLARVRVAGKQDQFVAAGLREGVDGVA